MTFSGNIRLRLPKDLHKRLDALADDAGVSLNTFMIMLLTEGATRRGGRSGAPRAVAEAMAEAVLNSIDTPTRAGQLISRLDAEQPDWRNWIPAARLAGRRKRRQG
jgi:hypothetical protein